jgi:hypothetical protein
MRYLVLSLLVISLCVTMGWAIEDAKPYVPIEDKPLITGYEDHHGIRWIDPNTLGPNPYLTDQHIGEVDTVGTTWYDYQHNGTAGRMVAVDYLGQVHVVWMNGLDPNQAQRHVYYNLLDATGAWVWDSTGVAVESSQRAGYACIGIDPFDVNYYPFPAFHQTTTTANHHAAVASDLLPGIGAFQTWECPWVYYPGGGDVESIWPKITADQDGYLHLINQENVGVAGAPQMIYYCRGLFEPPPTFNITYIDQEEIAVVETIAEDIHASPNSSRVAFVYTDIRDDDPDTNQYNNDIFLVVSEDGINWDFNDYTNVTDFIPPDPSLLPDTMAANRDTLRAYDDASVFFDMDDNIHVAFTVAWYNHYEGTISRNNSWLYHWCDDTEYLSLVADGSFDYQAPAGVWVLSCGAWQRYVQRPCIAQDPVSGDMFIVYQEYDTSSISAADFPQGEAMVSRSTTNGAYWSVATNVTDTHAPGAEAGHCLSERDITVNYTVEDGYLHIFYILDRDAGAVIQDPPEGAATLNPACYQKVPIDQIAAEPLVVPYPMHVDSTGQPPWPAPGVRQVESDKVPTSFRLAQNYPNPFNPVTNIRFDLTRSDRVTLKVYNIVGQEVATLVDGNLMAGTYEVPFDAAELSSGVYFYKLSTPWQVETRKMVLLK